VGKELTLYYLEHSEEHTIKIISEYAYKGPNYFAAGYAPWIIVSEQLVSELLDEPV